MNDVLTFVAVLAFIIVISVLKGRMVGGAADRNLERKRDRALALPDDSALNSPIDLEALRESTDELDDLAPRVSAVHIRRAPVDDSLDDYYEGYVVDSNGLPAGFALDADHATVRQQASWLANQLGVPLSDDT